jgi:predicted N-formylglutamate amidohydrolase
MSSKFGKTHFFKVNTKSNIIFTCEHASSRIPKSFKHLGLSQKDLKACKDLFDPGALDLFKLFVEKNKTSYIYSNISRLVIDTNRHLEASNRHNNKYHSALIKEKILVDMESGKKFLDIPYNQNITPEYELSLYNKVCIPYQHDLKKIIKKLQAKHKEIFIISIHTMFPTYNGPFRKQEIDLMGEETNDNFSEVVKVFKKAKNFEVGVNEPWGFKDVDYGVFFEIVKMKDVHVMAFEVRNDLVRTKKDVNKVFDQIAGKILQFSLSHK